MQKAVKFEDQSNEKARGMEPALKALEQEINNNNSNFAYLQELFLKKETMEKELHFAYDKWENCQ